ncbi:MAG: HPr family phosphocarrier protein [Firmicutes bacterium]|nr:HPr family phosphocarrier protein [Bacillota bacterium]
MVEKKVIVTLENGLESRQAARLVQEAVCYTSRIYIVMEDIQVNAKSIMGVVSLGALKDETVIVRAEGSDEEEAASAVAAMLGQDTL